MDDPESGSVHVQMGSHKIGDLMWFFLVAFFFARVAVANTGSLRLTS